MNEEKIEEQELSFGEKVEEFMTKHYNTILVSGVVIFGGLCYKILKKSSDKTDLKVDMMTMLTAYQLGNETKESI